MLKPNDTIGIIALAGDCDKISVDKAVQNVEKLGYKVKLSKNIYDSDRYLAGSDDSKIKELYDFFSDSDVKLILNARGGYGAIRLINKIDYNIIKNNPKPFVGYSDITAIDLMIYKKTGIVTYHGPMACSDFDADEAISEFTFENLIKALSNEQLCFNGDKIYRQGDSEGIIWGGNLSTVCSLCGIDFIPDKNFIFFAEDINEPVYKIDRMFAQLFNIDKFRDKCKGIVLGEFIGVDKPEWLDDLFVKLNCPAVGGFKITHGRDKITIPIGRRAKLSDRTLVIT